MRVNFNVYVLDLKEKKKRKQCCIAPKALLSIFFDTLQVLRADFGENKAHPNENVP